jgi:cysteine synthase
MGLALVAIIKELFASCQISNPKRKWIFYALLEQKWWCVPQMLSQQILVPIILFLEDWPKKHLIHVNQYDNPSNTTAHHESTGPEIWEQTEGK